VYVTRLRLEPEMRFERRDADHAFNGAVLMPSAELSVLRAIPIAALAGLLPIHGPLTSTYRITNARHLLGNAYAIT
jgi:hypothetical protein